MTKPLFRIGLMTLLFVNLPLAAQNWTAKLIEVEGMGEPRSIAYGNGVFVIASTPRNNAPSIAYSVDGINWQAPAGNNFGVGGTVLFHQGRFYYMAGDLVYRSESGREWTQIGRIPGGPFASASGYATDGSTYIFGSSSRQQPRPLKTNDFVNWEYAADLPTTPNPNTSFGYGAPAYGNNRFLINYRTTTDGGVNFEDKLAWSADAGASWTQVNGTQPQGRTLVFGNGRFLALDSIVRFTSTDAVNFTRHSGTGGLPLNTNLLGFIEGRFIALNHTPGTDFYESADGLSWTPFGSLPSEFSTDLAYITYGSGRFVAIGRVRDPVSGRPVATVFSAPFLTAPKIRTQPQSVTARVGDSTSIQIVADDPSGISYQWFKNNQTLAGETSNQLSWDAIEESDAGSYSCVMTNSLGSITSATAIVTVDAALQSGRLSNLSVLTLAGSGNDTLIAGFVLTGSGEKPMVIRGVGPELATYNVTGFVDDPSIALFVGQNTLTANDNWSGYTGGDLGAFPFAQDSLDSTISTNLAAGLYTAQLTHTGDSPGNALVEVYDGAVDLDALQLSNLSARVNLPANGSVTAGFVLAGVASADVLIRAVGPGLSEFLDNFLEDPTITLFRESDTLTENNDWSGDYGAEIGAFELNLGSKDSVIRINLEPGAYTARASSAESGAGGVVLIEVYLVP